MPAARASFCDDTTTLRARGVKRVKSCAGSFGTNRFCTACLLTPMLRPMSVHDAPGPAGPVDEVADEVVGGLAEMLGDHDRTADPVQRVGVGGLDAGDEIVQPGSPGHAHWFRHASTLS